MENSRNLKPHSAWLAAISLLLLGAVYVTQRWDYANSLLHFLGSPSMVPSITFVINRTIRMVVNDVLCFALIYALFGERKYLQIALIIFCFEFFLLLPVYLFMKLSIEGPTEISSPLLSPIHRLIVNPMMMLILIMALYFQRFRKLRQS